MKVIGFLTVLITIPLAGFAHAGFIDRHLEMLDVLYVVLETILVSQILVFLFIRFSRFKITNRINMRLLLFSKRLCMNCWINIFAACVLSSFVLTSYWYVFCERLSLLGIIPLFMFWVVYIAVVFSEKLRMRWLTGLKAIHFYLIASIGQIIGILISFLSIIIFCYIPKGYYGHNTSYLFGFPFIDDGNLFAKGMMDLSVCLAIPYLLLAIYRTSVFVIRMIQFSLSDIQDKHFTNDI